jgi:predicted peptidase
MKLKLPILILMTFVLFQTQAQDFSKYEKSVFVNKSDTLPYRILFPENFDSSKKYPLLLFLHGSGERGNDNEAQLKHGGKLFLDQETRQNSPAIIVFPQCPADSYWANVEVERNNSGKPLEFKFQKGGRPTKAMAALVGLTKRLTEKPFVDQEQIYVGGLSMGGMGTFEILRRKPKLFAAAFAICGGDNVKNVKKYKRVPLWIFHGEDDDVVPVAFSEKVVEALRDKDAEVKFTIYPGVKHNSWDNVFADTQFLPWLFSNSK